MLDSSFLKNSPLNFSFLTWDYEDRHFHEDIELLYVFDGQVNITIEDSTYVLNKDDFLIINTNKFHSFVSSKNQLIGSFMISYKELSNLINQSYLVFWCNSTIEKSNEYNEAKKKICEFANEFIKCSNDEVINVMAKFYDLLYFITKNFLITVNNLNQGQVIDDEKQRVEQITNFISMNYKNRISLTELSDMLYLSDAYLSKYIKKHFGMNFSDYLNTVRLNHSIELLLYTETPIIRIALDNGFASISTFNKVFKDVYGMTPSKYRTKYSKSNTKKDNKENFETMLKKAEEVFGVEEASLFNLEEENISIIEIDAAKKKPLKKIWNEVINIGSAEEILRSDIQKHILDIKNTLNIRYVRIWDLYSPTMLLNVNVKEGVYNFHQLDKVLDFLINNDIFPYLEINIKTKVLLRSVDDMLIRDDNVAAFEDLGIIEKFFNELIIHIINRYGRENVSNWYFEFWKNERFLEKQSWNITNENNDRVYLNQFSVIYKTIKKYVPEAKVGGAGLSTRYGDKVLYNLLVEWGKIDANPDFLSFYSYPYVVKNGDVENVNKISTNRNYIRDYIEKLKGFIEKSGIKANEFHLSEWNATVSNRNIFNDACYKGAYIMKNIIDNFDSVDVMGYWFASDISADFYDSAFLINGGCGLITKDSIKKPAFYAYDFLNRLGKRFVDKGENYLVSNNGYSEWGIVCHNYKFYGYQFFTSKEDVIDYNNINKYFENTESLELEYNLRGMENGNYDIKIYSINMQHGSLQDEWIRMSCPDNMTQQEIDYLIRICVPHLNIININVQDGNLSFRTKLEANEIQYINIRYRLK